MATSIERNTNKIIDQVMDSLFTQQEDMKVKAGVGDDGKQIPEAGRGTRVTRKQRGAGADALAIEAGGKQPGRFGELLLFNGDCGISNDIYLYRQQTEGYLAWKWGLQGNLPSNHPYKNNPPT